MAISIVSSNFALARSFDQLDRLFERIGLVDVDALTGLGNAFSNAHAQAPTWIPIDAPILDHAHRRLDAVTVRSTIFFSAISLTCAVVTLATLSRPGVFEPLSSSPPFEEVRHWRRLHLEGEGLVLVDR